MSTRVFSSALARSSSALDISRPSWMYRMAVDAPSAVAPLAPLPALAARHAHVHHVPGVGRARGRATRRGRGRGRSRGARRGAVAARGETLLRFTSRRPGIARAPPARVLRRELAQLRALQRGLEQRRTAESAGAGAPRRPTRAGAATAGAGTGETSVAIPASSSAAKSSSEDDEALMRARAGKCVGRESDGRWNARSDERERARLMTRTATGPSARFQRAPSSQHPRVSSTALSKLGRGALAVHILQRAPLLFAPCAPTPAPSSSPRASLSSRAARTRARSSTRTPSPAPPPWCARRAKISSPRARRS